MSADPLELRLLLQKYLYKNCTEDELDKFWQLIFELSDHEVVSAELKKLWDDNTLKEQPFSELPAWKKLSEKIQSEKHKNTKNNPKKMIVTPGLREHCYCEFGSSIKVFVNYFLERYYIGQKKLITVYQ